ncbi:DUF6428 family protein [Flavobacterium sp.]|uniref:DUF6428 family protein n=1 Tax=Flavobacterium sp. TaxID=239 RepID=UPI0035273E23
MKLSQLKALLPTLNAIAFKLENGMPVPKHFHITEIGVVTKKFIDCGGTLRNETVINFQLWSANDFEHCLQPQKILQIIELSEKELNIEDAIIEVEYQLETIGKYDLAFDGEYFILMNKKTACLAVDKCGVLTDKEKLNLKDLPSKKENVCLPNSNCC